MFSNRCYNGGQRHKFEGRYSTETSPGLQSVDGFKGIASDLIRLTEASQHRKKTYHYDICVWCGLMKKMEEKK